MCLQGQGRGRARALREERHAAGLRAPGHLEELQAQEDGEVRRCGDAADGLGRDRKLVVAHGAADVAEHQGLAVQRAQPGLRGQADRGLQRLLVAGRHRRGQRHHRGLRRGRRAAPALAAALAEALALGRLVHRQEGREEAVRQLHGARDLALVLQAPEQGLVVALGDAGAQDVAEVPEHGHEGQPLLVDELLPGLGVVALLAELRLEGHGLREAQPPARLALVEAAGQPGLLELLGARGVALAEDLHDQLLGLVDVAHADQALHAEHRAVPGRLAGLLLGFAALGAALGAALAAGQVLAAGDGAVGGLGPPDPDLGELVAEALVVLLLPRGAERAQRPQQPEEPHDGDEPQEHGLVEEPVVLLLCDAQLPHEEGQDPDLRDGAADQHELEDVPKVAEPVDGLVPDAHSHLQGEEGGEAVLVELELLLAPLELQDDDGGVRDDGEVDDQVEGHGLRVHDGRQHAADAEAGREGAGGEPEIHLPDEGHLVLRGRAVAAAARLLELLDLLDDLRHHVVPVVEPEDVAVGLGLVAVLALAEARALQCLGQGLPNEEEV
mmetsp:Transcript_77467/g.240761  ORF Transcript_77467/g.240761 Transcript_77467/m.240761 type:complete len:555 (-) Transcript_77467:1507-3171(-)